VRDMVEEPKKPSKPWARAPRRHSAYHRLTLCRLTRSSRAIAAWIILPAANKRPACLRIPSKSRKRQARYMVISPLAFTEGHVLPTGHQVLLAESVNEIGIHVLIEEGLEEQIGPVDHIVFISSSLRRESLDQEISPAGVFTKTSE